MQQTASSNGLDLNNFNEFNSATNTAKTSQYLNNSTNFHHRYPQYLNHHFELGNLFFFIKR